MLHDHGGGRGRDCGRDYGAMVETVRSARRQRLIRWLRVLLGAAILAGVVAAFVTQWPRVRPALDNFDAADLVLAFIAVAVALFASMLSWRAMLAELGSPLALRDAVRIFYVGQVGKYLPGSVWPVLAQMELGLAAGVPRSRMGVSFVLALALSLFTGGLIGLPTVLITGAYVIPAVIFVLVLLPLLVVPRLLNALLTRALRILRRPPLPRPLSLAGIWKVVGLAAIGWLAYGMQAWLLAVTLGAPALTALPVAIGAYAIAMVLGVLIVIAPAGVGVREVMLVIGLAAVLPSGPAAALAIVSRGLVTIADVLAAVLGLTLRRRTASLSVPRGAMAQPDTDNSRKR